ncbi:MAG: hypothetical protein A2Z14_02980 [Chloroflexi bacterium RBG_16_48_8]|nr:MAG: hypothetical protein A2Z14_02980 [Chloroflexi bacterium RBG_16_48_8]
MLSWVKAPRVLLVWPDRGNVLSRRLDLVLLKRYSFQRQIDIGLLTFDKEIRDEASEIGIPIFDSLDDLPEDEWTLSDRPQDRLQRNKDIEPVESSNRRPLEYSKGWFERLKPSQKVTLVMGVLLSLTVMVNIFMPSAQIILSPSLVREHFDFKIDLVQADNGGLESSEIAIHTIRLHSMGESTRSTSGLAKVPISAAVGTVVFTSLAQETIEIPLHTTLRTSGEDGIRFRTTRPANLGAEIGSEVEVPIEALTLGWIGNVPAGSISLIDGPLGLFVKVSNREPTSGGRDEVRGKVLQADLERLEEELINRLKNEAERDWAGSKPLDRILVENSLELNKVLDRHYDHVLGDVVDTISLELSLEFSALTLSTEDLQDLTTIQFSDVLSSDLMLVPGTFTFFSQMQESEDGSAPRWIQVAAEVDTFHAFDFGGMKRLIRGQQPSEAVGLLQERYPLSSPPDFHLKPSWYPILPMIDQRIHFSWNWEQGT